MSVNVYIERKFGGNRSLISPDEFLNWAKHDIKGGSRRSIANALTNAKRAIHGRIDEIITALRVSYASDWPQTPSTDIKLKVLKQINLPVTSIAKVLTVRRNDLEHSYLLPSLDQVRSDVETTELWLEKSKSYLKPSVVIIGLPVTSIGSGASATTKRSTFKATFAEPDKVVFYWDAKREIITLSKSGSTSRKKYHDYRWKKFIEIQKKSYLSHHSRQIVPSVSIATRLYKAYECWVLGNRGPSFTASKKFS